MGGQRRRRAIYGANTALVCGRKIFSLNKQDSQPRFPEALLSVRSSASKKKEKTSRVRDRGERKTALQPENKCFRASGAFAGGGRLGAVGKAGVPSCLPPPWAQGPGLSWLPSSPVGMAALGSEISQDPQPRPPNPTLALLCAGPGEMRHPRAQTTSCTEGPVAALTLQGVGRDLPAQHNPHPRKRQADVREDDGIGVSRGGSVGFNI